MPKNDCLLVLGFNILFSFPRFPLSCDVRPRLFELT